MVVVWTATAEESSFWKVGVMSVEKADAELGQL